MVTLAYFQDLISLTFLENLNLIPCSAKCTNKTNSHSSVPTPFSYQFCKHTTLYIIYSQSILFGATGIMSCFTMFLCVFNLFLRHFYTVNIYFLVWNVISTFNHGLHNHLTCWWKKKWNVFARVEDIGNFLWKHGCHR